MVMNSSNTHQKLWLNDWPAPSDYYHVTEETDSDVAAQAYYSCNALVYDRAVRFPDKRALASFGQDANGALVLEEYTYSTLNEMVNIAAEKLLALRGSQSGLQGRQDMFVGMLGSNSVAYLVNQLGLRRL
jgi:acyl-CoA synthetase (AMP-forming)/AMP-acid ligase II